MSSIKRLRCYVTTDLTYDQRMQRISTALAQAGYDTTLIGRKKNESVSIELDGVTTKRFYMPFKLGVAFYAWMNFRIFWDILFHRADAICAVDVDTLLGVTLACRLKNTPIVFDAHEWFTEVPELLNKPGKRKIWRAIEKYCLPKTTQRYTVNQSLASIFNEQFNLPFHVVRNVPIRDALNLVKTENKKVIIYQGALNVGRGIEASIQAMKYLPEFKLWLIGEGDLSNELRLLVNALGLENQVSFMGYKTPSELKTLTPQASFGLNLLAGESKNYYYSLANKFFDYMQAGVPSLNMRFPEYESILNEYHTGSMVDSCEPKVIADEILCMSRPDVYEAMVVASEEAAQVFHWGAESERLLAIWDEILN